jgi:hypothetical protein
LKGEELLSVLVFNLVVFFIVGLILVLMADRVLSFVVRFVLEVGVVARVHLIRVYSMGTSLFAQF